MREILKVYAVVIFSLGESNVVLAAITFSTALVLLLNVSFELTSKVKNAQEESPENAEEGGSSPGGFLVRLAQGLVSTFLSISSLFRAGTLVAVPPNKDVPPANVTTPEL